MAPFLLVFCKKDPHRYFRADGSFAVLSIAVTPMLAATATWVTLPALPFR
jgi:hypothetical protein